MSPECVWSTEHPTLFTSHLLSFYLSLLLQNYFFLLQIIIDFTSSINHFQLKSDVIVKKTSQWFKSCNPPPPGNWGVWIIIKFQRIKLHRGKLEGLGKKYQRGIELANQSPIFHAYSRMSWGSIYIYNRD